MERSDAAAGRLVDAAPIGGLQIVVFVVCALVSLLDGLDTQAISVTAPSMSRDLGIGRGELGLVFSLTQVGGIAGSLAFGWLGDRIGRKPTILAGLAIVAVFTLATAMTTNFVSLLGVRFAAGIALSGLFPCILALASDYAPRRVRGTIVALVYAAFPIGGALGGFGNGYLLSRYGWHSVFYVGALLPVVVAGLMAALVPESLSFLAARPGRAEQFREVLRRIAPAMPPETDHAPDLGGVDDRARSRVALRALFTAEMIGPTVALSCFYFFAFAITRTMASWLPTVLTDEGFSVAAAPIVLSFFNIGSTIGMPGSGVLIRVLGVRRSLTPSMLLAAILLVAMSFTGALPALIALAAAVGFLAGFADAGAHAIAALLFPADIRSTGLGWCIAVSRVGQAIMPGVVGLLLANALPPNLIYIAFAVLPVGAFVSSLVLSKRLRAA